MSEESRGSGRGRTDEGIVLAGGGSSVLPSDLHLPPTEPLDLTEILGLQS